MSWSACPVQSQLYQKKQVRYDAFKNVIDDKICSEEPWNNKTTGVAAVLCIPDSLDIEMLLLGLASIRAETVLH